MIVDPEFAGVMQQGAGAAQGRKPLLVIDVEDALYAGAAQRIGEHRLRGVPRRRRSASSRGSCPPDEWDAIALNYTCGTTGNPKGVVYHHRGAATQRGLATSSTGTCRKHAVYLWTLPMFHCNGWCFPWTMAARAGVNVCLRKVEAQAMLDADPRARRDALLRRADRARACWSTRPTS